MMAGGSSVGLLHAQCRTAHSGSWHVWSLSTRYESLEVGTLELLREHDIPKRRGCVPYGYLKMVGAAMYRRNYLM